MYASQYWAIGHYLGTTAPDTLLCRTKLQRLYITFISTGASFHLSNAFFLLMTTVISSCALLFHYRIVMSNIVHQFNYSFSSSSKLLFHLLPIFINHYIQSWSSGAATGGSEGALAPPLKIRLKEVTVHSPQWLYKKVFFIFFLIPFVIHQSIYNS